MKIHEVMNLGKSLVGMKINRKTDFAGKPWNGNFWCYNKNLASLEGAPSSVSGDFTCSDNNLTSLEGSPSSVGGDFWCYNNLTSLAMVHKHIKHINGGFYVGHNPIEGCVLGLLLIDGLKLVACDDKRDAMYPAIEIVNRYLPNRKGKSALLACQNELLDAGLEEYAKL